LGQHHRQFVELVQREPRVVWESFAGSGKSQMALAFLLFSLGRNNNVRCVIASHTQGQASKIGRAARLYIERSAPLRRVFPGLRPGTGVWRDDALVIERSGFQKDHSVQCVGVQGALLGARSDLLILDDVEDIGDATSQPTREATFQWVTGNLLTRTTPGAKVVVLGTPWHRTDTLRTLARSPGWASLRTPVRDPQTLLPTWPEQMGEARIQEMEMQLGPFSAPRALHLVAHSDEESVFKEAWLAEALEKGRGLDLWRFVPRREPGVRFVAGVDLAMSLGPKAAKTAIAVVAAHSDGRRVLVHLESFRAQIDGILGRVDHVLKNYRVHTIACEAVQAQRFVADLIKRLPSARGVRVEHFVTGGTGEQSILFQAELLASELSLGRWVIPSGDGQRIHPEVRQLVTEVLEWLPGDHPGDSLAALLFARSKCDMGVVQTGRLEWLCRR